MSREEWIDDDLADEIRELLNNSLRLDRFQNGVRDEEEEAALFFQEELFDRLLGFDRITGPTGQQPYRSIPVHDWPKSANTENAYLLSENGNFRVIYVELESLTRTAERNAVSALTNTDRLSAWALEGNYLAVFHERDSDIWHLVTPYEEEGTVAEGRSVLRRFTIGEGENHRTVSENLSGLTATQPGILSTRIDEAFRVRPVTEEFYDEYRHWFNRMEDTFLEEYSFDEDQKFEKAHRYAHLTLNRLMFFYFLQNKQWLGGRKNFVRWFHRQYEQSDDTECFHSKWLDALFFEGMNTREGTPPTADLPDEVEETIADLPYMNGGLFESESDEERNATLPDSLLSDVIENFLEQYNFTVTEESPYDVDVAVDPAMLGKIYESLIAEEERDEAGIFYTPRVEVDLMCRISLFEQFQERDTALSDEEIVEFLFSDPQDWEGDEVAQRDELRDVLGDLRIVDPACGSGAYLVGMKQVFTELYQKLGDNPDYELKEQIIDKNLYGVDIKDWAIRVAEFRLWLSLVEGEDQLPGQRPVLPNFSFKLKVGDSLIQKLDGEFVSLDTISRSMSGDTREQFAELKNMKSRYFEGEEELQDQIEQKQIELLKTHIENTIDELSADTSQSTLDGGTAGSNRDQEEEARIERLQEVRDAIDEAGVIDFFMWDIDFGEVMLDGGFDIVVGNPPYVRRETLYPQDISPKRIEEMSDTDVKSIKNEYVSDLREYVQQNYRIKPGKWSDLYIYFFFRGYEVLRPGGSLVYVTANSWLSSDYGEKLQEGLLKFGNLERIISNERQRTFEEAEVNTVISCLNKQGESGELPGETDFITVKQAYSNLSQADSFSRLLRVQSSTDPEQVNEIQTEFRREPVFVEESPILRKVSLSHEALWSLGGGAVQEPDASDKDESVYSEQHGVTGAQSSLSGYRDRDSSYVAGEYEGDMNWSVFVRAPDIFFEKVQSSLELKLEDVAHVHLGLNSGRNSFFYLKDEDVEEHGIEERFLTPLLKSPREIDKYSVEMDNLKYRVLDVQKDRDEIEGTAVLEYIRWGESQGYHNKPFFRSKDKSNWYKKTMYDSPLVQPRDVNTRHFTAINSGDVCVDVRLVCIDPDVDDAIIWGYLNSSVGVFIKELFGRVGLGGGALENYVGDMKPMPIFDPSSIPGDTVSEIEPIMGEMSGRDVQDIRDEIDASSPDEFTLDGVIDDRRRLDKIIMEKIMGLSEENQKELYRQLINLVNARIEKSESV